MKIEDKKKSKPLKSSKMGKPNSGSKMKSSSVKCSVDGSEEVTITDSKTKPLSSEQAAAKMASGPKGLSSATGKFSAGDPPPKTGVAQSNAKPLDASMWETDRQKAFSQALGKPCPREAFGGPTSNAKNSGQSNFGGKGKKVV